MKYILFSLGMIAMVSVSIAAEIAPQYLSVADNSRGIFWEQVNNDDTTGEAFWNGGCGVVEFADADTFADAEAELQFSVVSGETKSWDSDAAPDGLMFTSASKLGAGFWFPSGYMALNYSSAGQATQDHDIYVVPVPCE